MTYSLHPGAKQDVAEALDFYAEQTGALVAQRSLDEFNPVARLLVTYPGFGTPTTKGRRVLSYDVVYRSLDTGIRVIVVRHQHRKPG